MADSIGVDSISFLASRNLLACSLQSHLYLCVRSFLLHHVELLLPHASLLDEAILRLLELDICKKRLTTSRHLPLFR